MFGVGIIPILIESVKFGTVETLLLTCLPDCCSKAPLVNIAMWVTVCYSVLLWTAVKGVGRSVHKWHNQYFIVSLIFLVRLHGHIHKCLALAHSSV